MKAAQKEYIEIARDNMMKGLKVGEFLPIINAVTGEVGRRMTRNRNDVSIYAVVHEDGSIRHNDNTQCHAGLRTVARNAITVVNSVQNMKCEEKHGKRYLDYLFNRSTLSDTFITKDVDEAIERGCLLNFEVPTNVFICGVVAARGVSEYSKIGNRFGKLIDAGAPEHLAFVFAHAIQSNSDASELYIHSAETGNHTIFSWKGCRGVNHVNNYINGNFNRCPLYSKARGYEFGIMDVFNCVGSMGHDYSDDMYAFVKDYIKNKGKKAEPKKVAGNPFKKNMGRREENREGTISGPHAYPALVEFMKTIWKDQF